MSDLWTNWLAPFAGNFSLRVAITMLHFLWQGCAIGAMVFLLNRTIRSASATSRYLLHTVALMMLPLCVVMTFAVAEVPNGWRIVTTEELFAAKSNPSVDFKTAVSPDDLGDEMNSVVPMESPLVEAIHERSSLSASELAQETGLRDPSVAAAQGTEYQNATSEPTAKPQTQPLFPKLAQVIVLVYFLGVGLMLLRLAVAMWGGHRLRSASNSIDDPHLLRVVASQARKVGLRLVPVVRYCERVSVPVVVGVLRPVILLPASLMTGLAPDQFAAIVSHELAHIRRYDLLVNLLQRVVESVLFFHPAVWYLSHCMSTERETCCDDLVVSSGFEPMDYAGALLRMAEICSTSLSVDAHAVAASGDRPSQLESRIWRLVNMNQESRCRMTRAGALMIALLTLTVMGMPAIVCSLTQSEASESVEPLILKSNVESETMTNSLGSDNGVSNGDRISEDSALPADSPMDVEEAVTPGKNMPPDLKGRWRLISMIQDEHPPPAQALKGAYVDATDDLIIFHLPSKPDYPDLHFIYKFVGSGINIRIADSDRPQGIGVHLKGSWQYDGRLLKLALPSMEGIQPRPPVAPAKSVIYIELAREEERAPKAIPPKFATPEILMQHFADCQLRGDTVGCINCYSDEVVNGFATSYLMTAMIMRGDVFPGKSNQKHLKRDAEQQQSMNKLETLLKNAFIENPPAIASTALKQAAQSYLQFVDSDKQDALTNDQSALIATSHTMLKNPRQFVKDFAQWSNAAEDKQSKKPSKQRQYRIEYEGDLVWAVNIEDNSRMGLKRFKDKWLIHAPWSSTAEVAAPPDE